MLRTLSFLLLLGPIAAAEAQTAPSSFTTGYRYDAARRLTGTIAPDPDGTGPLRHAAVRNTYDVAGRLVKIEKGELSDWLGEEVAPLAWSGFTIHETTETAYDSMDRKTVEKASVGSPVPTLAQTSYDAHGRVECVALRMNPAAFGALPASACTLGTQGSYGPDRITRNVYDRAGQLLIVQKAYQITIANGFPAILQQNYAAYEYTDNGKQKAVTDANGNRAELRWDGHDRQSCWIFPSKTVAGALGGDCATGDFERYRYDANGNRIWLRKRDGSELSFQYDALNRMIAKIVPERSGLTAAQTRDVYYDYDLRGLQTKARFDSLAGEGITNVYDGFGLLVSSSSDMGGVVRTVGNLYDANGNRIRIAHPDTSYFTYDYDGLDRPTRIRENGGDPIVDFAYDAAGRRASSGRAAVTSYAYDPAGRLKTLSHDLAGTSRDHLLGFAYNPASQIVTRSASNDAYAWGGAVNTSRPYAVNGLNQYMSAGPATFGYDPNGNLASTANAPWSTAYVYDVENRLVSASGAQTAELVYDPLGRLFQVSSGTGVRRLVYDGDALVAEYEPGGYMVHRYIHGNDAGDDPLIWYDNWSGGWRRALMTDHQGSVIQVADLHGNPVATNSYDPWGIPAANNAGRFGYTGQAWVPELGLWYYKARFYSPTTGRFLQVDPVGYKDQINLYAYVGNDPVNRTDPTGATCIEAGEQKGGATKYACRIDSVAIVDAKGNMVGKRDPTDAENKRFAVFNARYTAAVNKLMRNPDKAVTVAAIHGKAGSFQTTAGKAAASMISREFLYIGKWNSDNMMVSPGVYSPQTGKVEGASTWVLQSGLNAHRAGIVHDGGLHATPEEWTGGLQAFPSPLASYEHQKQYNDASCKLLGETSCEP